MPYTLLLIVLGILVGHISFVEAFTNITIDNTSPLVVFSPTPCFQQNTSDCNPEWQLSENAADFNGSVTSTTGPDAAQGLTVVPRVSLVFQGSSIIFVPGQNSTARVTVVVDNLSSILLETASNAFLGSGLDPSTNHTVTITFVPDLFPTTLEVDYFFVELPDANTTSTSSPSSTFIPTPIPTALPSTTTSTPLPTSLPPSSTFTFHHPSHTLTPTQSSALPTGTIAAISISAALVLFLAVLAWFITLRRRRRRAALQREKAILYDLRLPSSIEAANHNHTFNNNHIGGRDRRISRVRRWGEEQLHRLRDRDRDRNLDHTSDRLGQVERQTEETELPWEITQRRETGKERERDSVPPPIHYTPWRTPHTQS